MGYETKTTDQCEMETENKKERDRNKENESEWVNMFSEWENKIMHNGFCENLLHSAHVFLQQPVCHWF